MKKNKPKEDKPKYSMEDLKLKVGSWEMDVWKTVIERLEGERETLKKEVLVNEKFLENAKWQLSIAEKKWNDQAKEGDE